MNPAFGAVRGFDQHLAVGDCGDDLGKPVPMPAGFGTGGEVEAGDAGAGVIDQLGGGAARAGHSSPSNTPPNTPISSSICPFEIMSGGDMAMMSPVVRMRMPLS